MQFKGLSTFNPAGHIKEGHVYTTKYMYFNTIFVSSSVSHNNLNAFDFDN